MPDPGPFTTCERPAPARCSRVNQHLRPAVETVVEVLVSLGRLVEVELVRGDQPGVQPVAVDQVAQLPAVVAALARALVETAVRRRVTASLPTWNGSSCCFAHGPGAPPGGG